jgi:hypothetical protein
MRKGTKRKSIRRKSIRRKSIRRKSIRRSGGGQGPSMPIEEKAETHNEKLARLSAERKKAQETYKREFAETDRLKREKTRKDREKEIERIEEESEVGYLGSVQ